MQSAPTLYARVILDSPLPQLDHPFDYAVPSRLRADVRVGQKVVVPLRSGKRRCDAWIIDLVDESEFGAKAAEVESIVSSVEMLPSSLYALARSVADRQAGSAVDVLRLAIPSRYVRAETAFLAEDRPAHVAPTQERVADRRYVQHSGGVTQLTSGEWVPCWAISFVERAAEQLNASYSTLCVLPDFRDIDYVTRAIAAAGLSDRTVRLDTGISGQQRWINYLRIVSGEALIIVGNRSSVYAPVTHLGLIQIWDDGNDSFHEPLAPYAHPRDVALVRQSLTGCSLVFASLVPTPAVARLVGLGFLTHVAEPKRSLTVIPTDAMTQDSVSSRIPPVVFTQGRVAIAQGPVLVQVAKPGYASSLRCAACRARAACTHCAGPLRQAKHHGPVSCRWCGRISTDFSCGSCHGHALAPAAAGGAKIADELGRAFPGARVLVADADAEVAEVEGKILVIATPGTEPVAAGGYAAVFVLDGEMARGREDLDTDVDALNQWMSATALARDNAKVYVSGTGAALGRVVATGDVMSFVTSELSSRESLALPPATRVAVITATPQVLEAVRASIEALPHRSLLGPVTLDTDTARIILTFDYRDGAAVATALRALIVTTATVPRKPNPATAPAAKPRVSRLSVRMDDAWLTLN
jgi:primosomal protein N' (replication factor Y)